MATTWMTTAGASETLGLTRPMVRKLLGDGDLLSAGNAGRILLTDKESVRRHKSRARIPCRKWSEKTSWAALTLISGDAPLHRRQFAVQPKNKSPMAVTVA